MKKPSIKKRLFDADPKSIKNMSHDEIIRLGKDAQTFIDNRVKGLGDWATAQTTSGQKVRGRGSVQTERQAIGAIQRARGVMSNPLSTRKGIKDAMKRSGVDKFEGNKIVVDPTTGKAKLVPKAHRGQSAQPGTKWSSTPGGRSKAAVRAFDDFKSWALDNTDWDSAEIVNKYYYAKSLGQDPVSYWEAQIETKAENYQADSEENIEPFLKVSEEMEGYDTTTKQSPQKTTTKKATPKRKTKKKGGKRK